ncbi:MAG: photosystem I reaction center protein subunit XI [Cyanobacteria bacterium QS_7_48_42]|jgi:photosystem I subunit 11|nr:MAG: photosystem I reaction center protein subunit XI [Cyanobacteria bacterium QH_1_48_107]PSO54659.1 MAG: photosystem I reaction center protein subunit XI [Cyanobacteria bacterium QH_10_48_56]PSO56429.1 MAG: photosystem I reaction center protein subunit XI [Cyanobacteria bacterium QH_7_48_89]PSO60522.1 MAG: photosystem I reaction center protein subunit XI [Cyanobacteria bacterium QH_2_48_84]PSO73134.1 MAG: photosystem I reaction center protein subunit XI [Cyanobacteria bacterium QH_3_48_40]
MADPRTTEVVKPYNDDVFTGHLATPVTTSGLTRVFVNNLPAYRRGISPIRRGLEIGMAHGYFLIGPWVLLGPLRDAPEKAANLGGLVSGIGLILIATAALSIYGQVAFPDVDETPGLEDNPRAPAIAQTSQRQSEYSTSQVPHLEDNPQAPELLKTRQGWSQFTTGFFIGATGGAFVAYFLLQNFPIVDQMFRGGVN